MKMLLSLLISVLFCVNCYSQPPTIGRVSPVASATTGCGGVASVTIVNQQYYANKLYIAVVFSTGTTDYGDNIVSSGVTWDTLSQIGNSTRRISVYRTYVTSGTTVNTTAGWTSAADGISLHIFEIANLSSSNNGANCIAEVVHDSATSSTTASITMSSAYNGGVLAFYSSNISVFGGTVESGWTESIDWGCGATIVNGFYCMFRENTTDNTPSTTMSSSTWIGTAVRIKGGRRIFSSN